MIKISPISLVKLGFEEENWTDENKLGSGVQDLKFSEFVLNLDFAKIIYIFVLLDEELIEETAQICINDEYTILENCDIHKIKRLITKIKVLENELK